MQFSALLKDVSNIFHKSVSLASVLFLPYWCLYDNITDPAFKQPTSVRTMPIYTSCYCHAPKSACNS